MLVAHKRLVPYRYRLESAAVWSEIRMCRSPKEMNSRLAAELFDQLSPCFRR